MALVLLASGRLAEADVSGYLCTEEGHTCTSENGTPIYLGNCELVTVNGVVYEQCDFTCQYPLHPEWGWGGTCLWTT